MNRVKSVLRYHTIFGNGTVLFSFLVEIPLFFIHNFGCTLTEDASSSSLVSEGHSGLFNTQQGSHSYLLSPPESGPR